MSRWAALILCGTKCTQTNFSKNCADLTIQIGMLLEILKYRESMVWVSVHRCKFKKCIDHNCKSLTYDIKLRNVQKNRLQIPKLNMPLVIMCGNPCSGKTTRSREIAAHLETKYGCKVVLINEESLQMDKNTFYATPKDQKILRGKIKFEVQKNLIGKNIVIVDSLNYIKGYRYQMYCIARQQKTTYCVVYCNTQLQACRKYNQTMLGNKFSVELFEDLSKRMQPPQLKNRWDIPLFERRQQQATPLQQITNTLLFEAKKSKDPVSTKQDEKLSENYLFELDSIVQQVCEQALMSKIKLVNSWSPMELKKVKKDFTNMAKQKIISLEKARESFLHYLVQADKRK